MWQAQQPRLSVTVKKDLVILPVNLGHLALTVTLHLPW